MRRLKKSIHSSKGFTLVEMLIALFCISFCTLLLTQFVALLAMFPNDSYDNDDVIAIRQLRVLLAQSKQVKAENNNLFFMYRKKENHLLFHHNRLIRQPGYEIFLKDINGGDFIEKEGCIYVVWHRNQPKQAILYCK